MPDVSMSNPSNPKTLPALAATITEECKAVGVEVNMYFNMVELYCRGYLPRGLNDQLLRSVIEQAEDVVKKYHKDLVNAIGTPSLSATQDEYERLRIMINDIILKDTDASFDVNLRMQRLLIDDVIQTRMDSRTNLYSAHQNYEQAIMEHWPKKLWRRLSRASSKENQCSGASSSRQLRETEGLLAGEALTNDSTTSSKDPGPRQLAAQYGPYSKPTIYHSSPYWVLVEHSFEAHAPLCRKMMKLTVTKLPLEIRHVIYDQLFKDLTFLVQKEYVLRPDNSEYEMEDERIDRIYAAHKRTSLNLLPRFLSEDTVDTVFLYDIYGYMYQKYQFFIEWDYSQRDNPLEEFFQHGPFLHRMQHSPAAFLRRLTISFVFPQPVAGYYPSDNIMHMACKTASTLLPLTKVTRKDGFKLELRIHCGSALAYRMLCSGLLSSVAHLKALGFEVDMKHANNGHYEWWGDDDELWLWLAGFRSVDEIPLDKAVWTAVSNVWSSSGMTAVSFTENRDY
ncbi:hypothetical protein P280DRAFT_481970 [Massarina eburnea CBS 473.64]|uniref:Uncharacterized protein n=1 Tax=Massarina eburnea CBS 473.64 TaxID=1395130 RepID=A0A6A6RTV6_9PLEO|nr:hypothetical protein P280DRAFT_481970 [Massarina eburnea CBS 473.64]